MLTVSNEPLSLASFPFPGTRFFLEHRKTVPKKTLRRYLLASLSPSTPTPSLSPSGQIPAFFQKRKALCSEAALKSWFDPLDITLQATKRELFVGFPHRFFQLRFAQLFQIIFEQAARDLWGSDLAFVYAIGKTAFAPPTPAPSSGTNTVSLSSPQLKQPVVSFSKEESTSFVEKTRQEKNKSATLRSGAVSSQNRHSSEPFGEEWTFETFISNGKHKWVLSLIKDLTQQSSRLPDPESRERPPFEESGVLVLCGPHGTGKTHLLRAVGNALYPIWGDTIFYASLSELETRFASTSSLTVRQELLNKHIILLDDVQHLARISPTGSPSFAATHSGWDNLRTAMQEELCFLLDRFLDQNKPVFLAGSGHPREWDLGQALFSRLETGLWAELPEPDMDVRLRYVQHQAKQRRLTLPREHLLLLAQHCQDIRRLSGVIRRVSSHRSLLGKDLSEQDILNIIRQSGDSSALTPQLIVSIVGEHCGVSPKEILGEKRRPDLVQARQIAMYLCRELLGHSYPVIGRMFGGKDHSTVMHGVKKIKQLQEHDRLAHTMVTELTKTCRERRG